MLGSGAHVPHLLPDPVSASLSSSAEQMKCDCIFHTGRLGESSELTSDESLREVTGLNKAPETSGLYRNCFCPASHVPPELVGTCPGLFLFHFLLPSSETHQYCPGNTELVGRDYFFLQISMEICHSRSGWLLYRLKNSALFSPDRAHLRVASFPSFGTVVKM